MISVLKRLASRLGIYDHLRYSAVYEQLLQLRNPNYLKHRTEDREFYRGVFDGRTLGTIFDVGANYGEKAVIFSQLATHVVCAEPDPRAVAALNVRFRLSPKVTVLAQAVGAEPGFADLLQAEAGSAYNSLSEKHVATHKLNPQKRVRVPVGTLEQMIQQFGVPDFLKVDVEGFEKEVFAGLSTPISLLCFEANVPQFLEESQAVIERLTTISDRYLFNAITNDEHRTWAFEQWTTGNRVSEHLASIKLGSADVFAKLA